MAAFRLIGGQELLVPNVAIEGEATQSSSHHHTTYHNLMGYDDPDDAHYAIDGNFSTDMHQSGARCAHAKYEFGAWWQVDLKNQFEIKKVAVTTRKNS